MTSNDQAQTIETQSPLSCFNYICDTNQKYYRNECNIKCLGLTCDDYIEPRLPAYSCDIPSTNISDIDLVKFNDGVSDTQ